MSSTKSSTGNSGEALARISPATEFDPSGAPLQSVPDVDPDHPAVDADPRKGTTARQNQIDFNDPNIPGHEAVERNLGLAPAAEDKKKD